MGIIMQIALTGSRNLSLEEEQEVYKNLNFWITNQNAD